MWSHPVDSRVLPVHVEAVDDVTEPKTLARSLADWSIQVRADDALVREQAGRMLLDFVGVVVGGAQTDLAQKVRTSLARHGDGSDRVLGTVDRMARPAAVFANAVAAHALEMDDGYTAGSVHPTAVVAPAVLAVVDAMDGTVGDALGAIAIGAEITCRLAAAGHPETYWRGFHNTSITGVIGAALGCSAGLGLPAHQRAHAVGLACSHAGGVFEFSEDGADTKRLHAGIAARDGWQCAEFASVGMTAPARSLEGRRGYFAAFAGRSDADQLKDEVITTLDGTWLIEDVYVKPYASCRALHASVDALRSIRADHNVDWTDVSRVTITTYRKAAEYCRTDIATLLDAQMSLPVAAVLALRFGSVGLADMTWAVTNPSLQDDMKRVTVLTDPDFEKLYPPLRPTHVAVETSDGHIFSRYVDRPYGEPGNPISIPDLDEKFHGLVDGVLGERRGIALRKAVGDLDRPVREVIELACPIAGS